jgi:hypothetical protein
MAVVISIGFGRGREEMSQRGRENEIVRWPLKFEPRADYLISFPIQNGNVD